MKSFILKADLLSPEYKVNFKGNKSTKTFCGVLTTVIVGCIIFAATVFFSLEMFLREAPFSRSMLRFSEDSSILLEEYPIMFGFYVNGGQFITDRITEDFIVSAKIINVDRNVPNYAYLSKLTVEPCKREFFQNNQDILDLVQLEAYLCINPFKMHDMENNILNQKPLIARDFAENLSKTIGIEVFKKSSLSNEQFKQKYGRIDMIFSSPERFVDVEDYANPIKTKVVTNQIIIDNNIVTTSYMKTSKESLRTDTGIVLENYKKEEYFTFKTIEFKYNTKTEGELVSETFINSTSFAVLQSREYLKAQTVFAQVGGIAKAITFIAKLLVGIVSKYRFYCDNVVISKSTQNRAVNNSAVDLNIRNDKENSKNSADTHFKLTFWKFLFWRKQTFNEHFTPRITFEKQFDVQRINKILENLVEIEADRRPSRPGTISRLK